MEEIQKIKSPKGTPLNMLTDEALKANSSLVEIREALIKWMTGKNLEFTNWAHASNMAEIADDLERIEERIKSVTPKFTQ